MTHCVATKVTFTEAYLDMSEEQRLAEQTAAYEIVAKHGGELKGQWVLMSEGALLTIVEYPDEQSSIKSQIAIATRRAFQLQTQRAMPLEEYLPLLEAATAL